MNYFKIGELVEVLDISTPKLFRKAVIIKSYSTTELYKVSLLDCNDTIKLPINKIRKLYDN